MPDSASDEQLLAEVEVLHRQVGALYERLVARGSRRGGSAPSAPARLYATFLGRFELHRGGQAVDLPRDRSVLELCRYLLAYAGRPVPRDELVELLWPGARSGPTLHRLHVTISRLRRLLDGDGAGPSLVLHGDESYLIDDRFVDTDCGQLEQWYRRGRAQAAHGDPSSAAASFRAALALYRGDYLAEHPYAEWTHQHRAHLVERRLGMLTYLGELALAEDPTEALEHAHTMLAVDPLRERAHRLVMRAHSRLGEPGCALRQYDVCADLLRRELDAEPSGLTRALREAIREGAPLPPEAPRGRRQPTDRAADGVGAAGLLNGR